MSAVNRLEFWIQLSALKSEYQSNFSTFTLFFQLRAADVLLALLFGTGVTATSDGDIPDPHL